MVRQQHADSSVRQALQGSDRFEHLGGIVLRPHWREIGQGFDGQQVHGLAIVHGADLFEQVEPLFDRGLALERSAKPVYVAVEVQLEAAIPPHFAGFLAHDHGPAGSHRQPGEDAARL